MKTASKIMLLVNAILAIFVVLGLVIAGLVIIGFITTPEARETILKLIDEGKITTNTTMTREQLADFVIGVYVGLGAGFIAGGVLNIPNAVFSFIAQAKEKKAFYIVAMIFSVLGGTMVGLAGSILGIVAHRHDQE